MHGNGKKHRIKLTDINKESCVLNRQCFKERDMKKVIILCLVAGMLLLSGCSQQKNLDSDPLQTSGGTESEIDTESAVDTESTGDAGNTPETPSLQTFGYAQEDITSVIFIDLNKGISVDVSANSALKAGLMSVKYNPDQKKSDAGKAVYELKINGKSLYVYPENVVAYDGSDPYPCLAFGMLSYLDGLLNGEVTQLGGYAESASIKVKNSQGLIAQVSDSAEFFAELGRVKIIKLARVSDYTLPDTEYTVLIGEERVVICGDYLSVGEHLYAVAEGDFSFLSEYKFSSSSDGFLPWI
jgi:hypothetical protein